MALKLIFEQNYNLELWEFPISLYRNLEENTCAKTRLHSNQDLMNMHLISSDLFISTIRTKKAKLSEELPFEVEEMLLKSNIDEGNDAGDDKSDDNENDNDDKNDEDEDEDL